MANFKIPNWLKNGLASLLWNLISAGVLAMISFFETWYLSHQNYDWGLILILVFISVGVALILLDRLRQLFRSYSLPSGNQAVAVQEAVSGTEHKPIASKEEMLQGTISGKEVLIYEVPRQGTVIRHKTFEECDIIGPAILCPLSMQFDLCLFTYEGNPDAILWKIPEEKSTAGAILLEGCRFNHCKFIGIGFCGPKKTLAVFKQLLKPKP